MLADMTSETSRFSNIKLESLVGEIYGLCKDQHGCRYLQKKLEDGDAENIRLIYDETHPHMIELMTGRCSLYFDYWSRADIAFRSFWQLPLSEAFGVRQ